MARTDPADIVFDIIKAGAIAIIGFIIIKALLGAFASS